MATPIDLSLNQSLPIKSLSKGLELAAKNATINATVLSSKVATSAQPMASTLTSKSTGHKDEGKLKKLLSNNLTNSGTSTNKLQASVQSKAIGDQLFQVLLSTGKGNFIVTSKTPLNPGTPILIKMTEQGLTLTIKATADKSVSTPENTISTKQKTSQNYDQLNRSTNVKLSASKQQITDTNNLLGTDNRTRQNLTTMQVIDNGIRQSLPLQQSIRSLVPLLQQLSQSPNQAKKNVMNSTLPKELTTTLKKMLEQLPTSTKIQNPLHLKTAVKNSGIFLEAKLAQSMSSKNPVASKNSSTAINNDIKALSQKLLAFINNTSSVKNSTANPPVANTTASTTASTTTSTTVSGQAKNAASLPETAVNPSLLTKPLPTLSSSATPPTSVSTAAIGEENELTALSPSKAIANQDSNSIQVAKREAEQNMDIALRQLGRQLLASIARTQLNQLESLSARQVNNPDNQGPVNSWTLEIPILNGKHIDNLELRIDQEEYSNDDSEDEKSEKKEWTVMLDFDLHALGKMNIQLKVLDDSVSAMIWSALEHTHQEVKQHIQYLRESLEKVGVNVQQVECKLGSPPKSPTPLQRQLVDVRT